MSYGDDVDRERNRMALERIGFHLDEALRFCSQLDLSGLGPLEQKEWDSRMKRVPYPLKSWAQNERNA